VRKYKFNNSRPINKLIAYKCLWPILILATLIPGYAHAHALGQSYIFLSVFEESIEGRVEIPVTALNDALGLDFRTDQTVVEEDVDRRINAILEYVVERVRLAPNGIPAEIRVTQHHLFSVSFTQYVVVQFIIDGLAEPPEFVNIDFSAIFDVDSEHRGLLVIENNWKTSTFNNEANVSLIFAPDSREQRLDLAGSSKLRGFAGMIELGMHHIAIGMDHILFIIALLLPSVMRREDRVWQPVPEFRTALLNVVKIVTIFTIAHSITLSLAVLDLLQVPPRLVESVIAASIGLVSLNIIFPIYRHGVWWVVFAFGLFHGFGFASVLAEMGVHSNYVILTLLGFNIGIEIGQLIIVCLVFPALYLLRTTAVYKRIGLTCGAITLVLVSTYWLIERAFMIDLPAGQLANQVIDLFR